MKKIISLFAALTLSVGLWAAGTFTELADAIESISDGGTLTLTKDYVKEGTYSKDGICTNKNMTIDLNGHYISANWNGRIFRVDWGALTIINSQPAKDANGYPTQGKLCEGNFTYNTNGGLISLADGKRSLSISDVILDGGQLPLDKETNGGAIYAHPNVTNLSITNCVFRYCYAKYGGAIESQCPTTISHCYFHNNGVLENPWSCTSSGGCIYGMGLTITDCLFDNNIGLNGGVLFSIGNESSKMNYVTGCTFTNNQSVYDNANRGGGAICVWTYGLSLKNTTITNCSAHRTGGGVFLYSGWVSFEGTNIIKGNTAAYGNNFALCNTGTYPTAFSGSIEGSDIRFSILDPSDQYVTGTLTQEYSTYNGGHDLFQYFKYEGGTSSYHQAWTNDGKDIQVVSGTTTFVSSISLSPTSKTLYLNGTTDEKSVTLTSTIAPANATCKTITWNSSNTNVATVNASGVVTAIGLGETTITATAIDGSDKSASCAITVANLKRVVTYGDNITVSPDFTSGDEVLCGTEITFTAAERTGYAFRGFYKESTFSTLITEGVDGQTYNVTVADADISVYAKYEEISPTYIREAQCTMHDGKFLINGQFVIIKDNKMYNAQGIEL